MIVIEAKLLPKSMFKTQLIFSNWFDKLKFLTNQKPTDGSTKLMEQFTTMIIKMLMDNHTLENRNYDF